MEDKKITHVFEPDRGMIPVGENFGIVDKPKVQSSWKRGGMAGAADFSFEFEGATVFCRYPKDFAEIEEAQNAIVEAAQKLDEDNAAFFAEQVKDPQKDFSVEAAALESRADELTLRSARFSYDVVQKCVIAWKDAPLPYSDENKAQLPLRLMQSWFMPILENSRLSKVEADFLAGNSAPL